MQSKTLRADVPGVQASGNLRRAAPAGRTRLVALLLVVALTLLLLRITTELLGPGTPAALIVFGSVEAVVAYVSAGYLAVLGRDRSFPPWSRRTWMLMAAALASWAVGQTIFAFVDVLGLGQLVEGAADVLFFVFGLLMVASAVQQLRGRAGPGTGVRTVLDGVLMGLSILTVLWVVWLGEAASQYTGTGLDLVLPFTFPVLDVVFLTTTIMMSLRVGVSLSSIASVLGAVVLAVADGLYVFGITTPDGFTTGGPADYLWILAFALFAIGAGQRKVTRIVPPSTWQASWAVFLPYLALLPAAGFAVLRLWTNSDRLVLAALLTMTVLAMLRQFLVLADHRRLLGVNERQREQLAVMAHIDSLTGLVNRRRFSELLEDAVQDSMASATAIVVAFVDLDRFKVVNDTLGHQAGDELLCAVADRLRSCVRPGDWAGRWGGDEFAVLVTDPFVSAEEVVARLRDAMAHPFVVAGQSMSASASVGAVREVPVVRRGAVAGDVTEVVDALLAAADAEMYVVKRGPRNERVVG